MKTARAFRLKILAPAIVFAGLAFAYSAGAHAQSRCPAGSSGCTIDNAHDRVREIVRDGVADMFSRPGTYNNSVGSAVGRVRRGGQIIRDCVQCGTDAVREGMDRITTGSGTR